MVLKKMDYNLTGDIPDYGAIFMSNSSTKDECLKRNLFGLPAPYGRFVKNVRVGMILFLFEYEKRQLHGVFQACSNGDMDIVPHAFVKAGRRCPSQVKVKNIWFCEPLLEEEFGNAIKENYVTRYKFSFGLSETQVRRLLHLFSSKVLRPQKRLKEKSVPSSEKVRKVDASRTKAHGGLQRYGSGFNNMDIDLREAFEKGYSRLDSIEMEQSGYRSAERVPNDTGFQMNENEYCEDRARNDEVLMRKNDFQNECYKCDGVAPPVLYDDYVSKPDWSSFSKNPLGIAADPLAPSTTVVSKPCYTDGVSMVIHPYNRADSVLRDYIPLCSDEDPRFTTEEYNPDYGVSEKVQSSFMRNSEDKIATLGDYSTFSGPGPSESANYGTHMGFSQMGFSRNLDGVSNVPSSSRFSLEDVPELFPLSRNIGNENTFSDYTVKTNVYPSADQIEQENQLRYEAAQRKAIKESFVAGVASAKCEDPYKFQGPLSSVNPQNSFVPNVAPIKNEDPYGFQAPPSSVNTQNSFVPNVVSMKNEDPYRFQAPPASVNPQNQQGYKRNSMEYDPEHYQYSDSFYSDSSKKRTSVFSRLARGPNVNLPESKAAKSYDVVHDESISVDAIMKTLQRNHQHWVKPNKLNVRTRKDNEKKPKVKENTEEDVNSPVMSDYDDDEDMDYSFAGMTQETKLIKTDPFLNFKRRSEKRKLHNDDDAISRVESVTGMNQRKRKLIRPDFSKNASPGDSDMKNSTSLESGQRDCAEESLMNDISVQTGTNLGNYEGKDSGVLKETELEQSLGICDKTGEFFVQESSMGLEKGAETERKTDESCPVLVQEGTETGNEFEVSFPGQHKEETESEIPNKFEESFPALRNEGAEIGIQIEEFVPGQHKEVNEGTGNRFEEPFPGKHKEGTETGVKFEESFPDQRKEETETGNKLEESFPGLHKGRTEIGVEFEESFSGLRNDGDETGNKFEESFQGQLKEGTETGVKFEESFQGQEKKGTETGNKFAVSFLGQRKEETETANKLEESFPGLHNEGTENGNDIEESFSGPHKEGIESENKMKESFWGLTNEGTEIGNKFEESFPVQRKEGTETETETGKKFEESKESERNAKADSFLPSSQSVDEAPIEDLSDRGRIDEINSSRVQASEEQEMPEIPSETTPKKRKLKR